MRKVEKLPGTPIYRFFKDDKVLFFNPYTLQTVRSPIDGTETLASVPDLLGSRDAHVTNRGISRFRVEVTLKCNGACNYCLVFRNNIRQLHSSMQITTAEQIVKRFNKLDNGLMLIIGGEPLINWPVVKFLIEHAQGQKLLFTNGTLITPAIAQFMAQRSVMVCLSLDGTKEDNSQRVYTNGVPMYDDALRGYWLLRENDCRTAITCLAVRENAQRMADIAEHFMRDLRPETIGISLPHLVSDADVDVDIREYTKGLMQIFELAQRYRVNVVQIAQRLRPLITREFRAISCRVAGEQIAFYPNGEETLCTKLDKLSNAEPLVAGTLFQNAPIHNPFCTDCFAIGICGGGCYWDGLTRFGSFVDKRECHINKTLLEFLLWELYGTALPEHDQQRRIEDEYGWMVR